MLNPTIEKKFIEVLNAIRTNDPKLTANEKNLFDDADFDDAEGDLLGARKKKSADKPLTLKDQIRKHTLKKMHKDHQSGSESGSDDDEDISDADDKDVKSKKKHSKESKLFTKIGVSKHDEEA